MALIGNTDEEKIWNFLKGKGLNDYGAAGLWGNLYAESGLKSTNLQNSFEKKLGLTDNEYTNAVDNGNYTNFVKDSAGYGLAQWTYWSRKQNLLNFAKQKGKSIGDLETQLEFLWKELVEGYASSVLSVLKSTTSILEASNVVLMKFERPANMGTSVQNKRAEYSRMGYNRFVGKTVTTTTTSTTKKSVEEVAKEVLNGKWGNGSQRKTKLEAAGYSYTEVQAKVNELSSASSTKKSIEIIAKEVLNGKWGNGTTRKQKLEAAGYNYNEVQKKVNELCKK